MSTKSLTPESLVSLAAIMNAARSIGIQADHFSRVEALVAGHINDITVVDGVSAENVGGIRDAFRKHLELLALVRQSAAVIQEISEAALLAYLDYPYSEDNPKEEEGKK